MYKLFIGVALVGSLFSCSGEEEKKEEKKDAKVEVSAPAIMLRGVDFDTTTVLNVGDVMAKMEGLDSLEDVVLRASVIKTCKKKGCWMTVNMGENNPEMRVWFKDYDFFVPLDGDGVEVVISGKAFRSAISVDDQIHLLKDENATEEEIAAITEPKIELGFEATGVYLFGYEGEELETKEDSKEEE